MGFSNKKTSSRGSSSSRGGSRSSSRGSSSRGNSRGNYNSSSNNEWIRLGSLTKSKKQTEEHGDHYHDFCEDLMEFQFKANVKVFPPKGIDSVEIKRGDLIQVSFMEPREDEPDFRIGVISVLPND